MSQSTLRIYRDGQEAKTDIATRLSSDTTTEQAIVLQKSNQNWFTSRLSSIDSEGSARVCDDCNDTLGIDAKFW